MESVNMKNLCTGMALLNEEKRSNKEPEKVHSTGEFVFKAKFGVRVLHYLASSLANVIRQV